MPGFHAHTYKFLATSWGVHITIAGSAGTLPASPPSHQALLRDGLNRARLRRPILVNISEVRFVDTDFQEEGLPVAMCRWLERVFDLPPRKIVESFDKTANQYHFTWNED
ncbi:hypothetical protein ACPZ19_21510 [Amycolatopsis lurida]